MNAGQIFSKEGTIALAALIGIFGHIVLRVFGYQDFSLLPLYVVLIFGGTQLVYELLIKAIKGQFGSDLLAGISIITSVLLGEYLAGSLVVLMLSGGEALERFAVQRASSVLLALAKRMPNIAHRKVENGILDVPLNDISIGDLLIVMPHEICPVDGLVVEGKSVMDESYLTGEPFEISKTPGSEVLSGSVNGDGALTINATKLPVDSRYARIMEVMRKAESERPPMRRLADRLGAFYTPFALLIAVTAWIVSGEAVRFLSVLVIATPCPLLIAIPTAIIGSISLAARRGIIIRNPSVLEQISTCSTIILDKTGTLTYGEPKVSDIVVGKNFSKEELISFSGSLEQYSKHPLSAAILKAAKMHKVPLIDVSEISEKPGQGLIGKIGGKTVEITSRKKVLERKLATEDELPVYKSGMEAFVVIGGEFGGLFRFHDEPRSDSHSFVRHLGPRHKFKRVMIVSGDRESEVKYLAEKVGINEIYAGQSPEQKVEIVRSETKNSKTLFLGDGINDAPALMTATVGVAFGQHSDITSEAAGAVIMDTSLVKVDELFHIGDRMRKIALQSAVGGMIISIIGMFIAAVGLLPPVAGAITQEVIDLVAVLNSLRAAVKPKELTDF